MIQFFYFSLFSSKNCLHAIYFNHTFSLFQLPSDLPCPPCPINFHDFFSVCRGVVLFSFDIFLSYCLLVSIFCFGEREREGGGDYCLNCCVGCSSRCSYKSVIHSSASLYNCISYLGSVRSLKGHWSLLSKFHLALEFFLEDTKENVSMI